MYPGLLYRQVFKNGDINNNYWMLFFEDEDFKSSENGYTRGRSWDKYSQKIEKSTSTKIEYLSSQTDEDFCKECHLINVPIKYKKDCCRRRKCYF